MNLSRRNFAGAGIGVVKAAGLDALGAVGLISLALCVAAFCVEGASAATKDEDWLLQTNGLAKASAPVAARLPNVLILGDSISLGYTPIVKTMLAGKANVSRPSCNCGPSQTYLKNMKNWVGTNRWDVIHVNFGVWDNHYLKGPRDGMGLFWGREITNALPPSAKGTAIRDLGFTIRTPIRVYEKNLRTILAFLKQHTDRVVFGLTTPVPLFDKDDRCGRIRVYNEVAESVCAEMGVAVDDLYAVAERNYDKQTDGAHFNQQGYAALAASVVKSVEKAWTTAADPAGELVRLPLLPGELWWGGTVGGGYRMPLDETSDYAKDLRVDSDGNQAAPLLLSTKGRWVWCEDAFRYTVRSGVLTVETGLLSPAPGRRCAPIQTGVAAGGTLRAAFVHCSRNFFPPKGHPKLEFFREPILNTWVELNYNQNEADVLRYAQSFLDNGMKPGVFMIDCFWQTDAFGPWTFHGARFSDPKGLSDKLHAMGYKLMLWMSPFVTLDSMPYRYLRDNGGVLKCAAGAGARDYQASEFNSALAQEGFTVRWWDGLSAIYDPTSPFGRKWMKDTLDRVMRDYGVDGFFFDGAGPHEFPPGTYAAHDRTAQPMDLTRAYQSMGLEVPYQQLREAWKLGGEPMMNTLRDKAPTWPEMRRCVTDMIAAGQLGYPFVVADLVGGGTCGNNGSGIVGVNWQEELFIRHLQIECLSPMIQFSGSPWRILSPKGQEIVRKMLKLRARFAPRIEAMAVSCGKTGLPMLRSMDFEFPNCGYERVLDQFMMGDDLLVAPVVTGGAKERTVEIPAGTWTADDGTVVTGPKRVTVATPLDRLVHFTRQ